jgi:magnesium transporter
MDDLTQLLLPNILSDLEEGNLSTLRDVVHRLHPSDLADILREMPQDRMIEMMGVMDRETIATTLEQLELMYQKQIIRGLDGELAAGVLETMAADERVDIIKAVSEEVRDNLLPRISVAERNDIRQLASYEEETAGAIMTSEFAYLPQSLQAQEAIERVRDFARKPEQIYYLYLVNERNRLTGIVTLRDLLTCPADTRLTDIAQTELVEVDPETDQEEVARMIRKYDLFAVPVTDESGALVGIVTADDVMDVLVEEDTEDMYRYGAAGEPVNYRMVPSTTIYWQRLPWLFFLVFAGLVSSYVLQIIETYQELYGNLFAMLVMLTPMMNASGGNAGVQSSTTVVRGLATGELTTGDLASIVYKEIKTGLLLGGSLAAIMLLRLIMFPDLGGNLVRIGATAFLAMMFAISFATTLGAILPIIFDKLGMDPALMSGPFITSIVDICTITIYFSLAALII